jgi:hypothetical protein
MRRQDRGNGIKAQRSRKIPCIENTKLKRRRREREGEGIKEGKY